VVAVAIATSVSRLRLSASPLAIPVPSRHPPYSLLSAFKIPIPPGASVMSRTATVLAFRNVVTFTEFSFYPEFDSPLKFDNFSTITKLSKTGY
jgi:hypothetical protein